MHLKKTALILVSALLLAACGSTDNSSIEITGPALDLAEVKSMAVDQFYINGGTTDEFNSKGEFSVYLRDGTSGEDVACAAATNGMDKLSIGGIYYGGLSIPLTEVLTEHSDSLLYFQLVFVEQDGEGCPNPIGADDEIVGQSDVLMFDALLNKPIWTTNGLASAALRAVTSEAVNVSSMSPAFEEALAIDKLYFEDGANESGSYILFAERMVNGTAAYISQVDDSSMQNIHFGGIVYSALGFTFPQIDSSNPDFSTMSVRVGLYAQRENGTELIAQTEAKPVEDLIGEKIPFADNKGYVSFRNVVKAILSSSVVRLSDLTGLKVTSLAYTPEPSTALSTIELHVMNADDDYMLACAGTGQGLTGVGSPGTYQNLSAAFVAAEGQTDLFGAEEVKLRLVERTDSHACPTPLSAAPRTIATSENLTASALAAGNITFTGGKGSAVVAKIE